MEACLYYIYCTPTSEYCIARRHAVRCFQFCLVCVIKYAAWAIADWNRIARTDWISRDWTPQPSPAPGGREFTAQPRRRSPERRAYAKPKARRACTPMCTPQPSAGFDIEERAPGQRRAAAARSAVVRASCRTRRRRLPATTRRRQLPATTRRRGSTAGLSCCDTRRGIDRCGMPSASGD